MKFTPETIHARLGAEFYDEVQPAAFPLLKLRFRNQQQAENVGLGSLSEADWLRHFGAFQPFQGSLLQPLALRYHGHQFRSYNPDLGDGRGFLFAQMRDAQGRLLDFGTKGSGVTPWSRSGDGRLTLKGGVREVLATQMLEALGVNTSKSFSLIETGEELTRGDEPSPTRSAVLTRLSHSHIRIGTFQRLAFLGEKANIERLLDHCLTYYMPHVARGTLAADIENFLQEVARNLARTTAQWMVAGFVHGVLNSDNINITGESFDYGPWRFLPSYDPNFTAAYFDHTGLYAFGRQPSAVGWNLTRLAECFVDMAPMPVLESALDHFAENLQPEFARALIRRLGVKSNGFLADHALANGFFKALHETQTPFEAAFFDWYGNDAGRALGCTRSAAYTSEAFAPARHLLANYTAHPQARLGHSYFAGSGCTLLIEDVEALWAPIAAQDDWSAFEDKLRHIGAMAEAFQLNPEI